MGDEPARRLAGRVPSSDRRRPARPGLGVFAERRCLHWRRAHGGDRAIVDAPIVDDGMPHTSRTSDCPSRTARALQPGPRHATVSRAGKCQLAYRRYRQPGDDRRVDESLRPCREPRQQRVPLASDVWAVCLSPHQRGLSGRARGRPEVPHRRGQDDRPDRCPHRRPTRRRRLAHPGRPARCTPTRRAAHRCRLLDGTPLPHHPLSMGPASGEPLLPRAHFVATGIRRSGHANCGRDRRLRPHQGPSRLTGVRALPGGSPDRALCR